MIQSLIEFDYTLGNATHPIIRYQDIYIYIYIYIYMNSELQTDLVLNKEKIQTTLNVTVK